MTTCRTHESGGTPGSPARPANLTRTGSGASRAASHAASHAASRAASRVASRPERTRRVLAALAAAAAARPSQPPDLALLRRVRDGLNRL